MMTAGLRAPRALVQTQCRPATRLAAKVPCLRYTALGAHVLLQRARLFWRSALSGFRASPRAAAAADAVLDSGSLWLVVGLGNPGAKYERTRHNVGFLAIDALAAAEGISVANQQLRALVGRGTVAGTPVLLVKPQTFMNSSGEAVVPLLKYYKVPPSRCLVLYDDLDIDVAALRLRQKGGHGGHNGMRSIITCLGGSQDFPRLRIGIGRPQGNRQVVDHVLTTFDKHESDDVEVSIQQTIDIVRSVLSIGVEKAVSLSGAAGSVAKQPARPKADKTQVT